MATFSVGVAAVLVPTGTAQTGTDRPVTRSASEWAEGFDGAPSFTKPSADAVMGFTVATRVTQTLVKGGELVDEGQVLIRGDDGEQLAILDQTRMRVESDLTLRRATKEEALAKVEFERAQEGFERQGVSTRELDRARLTWETAEIGVETAKFNTQLERSRLVQARALLDQYRITAPFDGVVEEVYRVPGSSVDRTEAVIRVVRVDPVWIDVPVPTEETIARGLSDGDEAWVLIDTPDGGFLGSGKIIEVSPVADFASGTRRVRVELPNPGRLPPGLRCWTRFDTPSEGWADEWSRFGTGTSSGGTPTGSDPGR
ncbi:MAG: efflux RND transporter periplasmic adaptor subunit [Planctomycetota bacterium]